MISKSLYFALILALVLAVTAALHGAYLYANQISFGWDIMTLCYGINFLLALGIYITLLQLAKQKSQYLGFVFLFGSAFKFLAYFLIFDPLFKQDGNLSTHEFFMFFVPYFASLIAETIALVNLLKTIR